MKRLSSRRRAEKKKTILFICTGNTCRSPMAVGFFQKLLEEKNIDVFDVRSAGVCTVSGLLPTSESILLLDKEGKDIRKHRSRQLTVDMIKKADLILGMTPYHIQTAYRISELARGKSFLLMEYSRSNSKNPQIPDPMGCTLEVYKKCFSRIKRSVKKLFKANIVEDLLGEQGTQAEKKPTHGREPGKVSETTLKAPKVKPIKAETSKVKANKNKVAKAKPKKDKVVKVKTSKAKLAKSKGAKGKATKAKPTKGKAVKAKAGDSKLRARKKAVVKSISKKKVSAATTRSPKKVTRARKTKQKRG